MRGGEVLFVVLVVALVLYLLAREKAPEEPGPVRVRMGPHGAAIDYQAETAGGGCCG